MTQLAQPVAIANAVDVKTDDKCPFCHTKPKNHATKKPQEVNDKVTSDPSALNCKWKKKREDGDLPYTAAAHHLISAMQCYKQIRRLVRMGNMVGYDINNETNGLGLPTTHWTLKYIESGKKKKYGDLVDPEGKRRVAFALMKELKAQWHVGHHAFEIKVSKKNYNSWMESGAEEKDDADAPHETSYDTLIIGKLFAAMNNLPKDLCEDPKKEDKFKSEMNQISNEIRDLLNKFNGENGAKPADSDPLFVSMRAYEYSGVADMFDTDITVNDTGW